MKIVVAYDGSLHAREALRNGIGMAKGKGAELVVMHVFNSNAFIDYEVSPGAIEYARRESAGYLEDARSILNKEGKGIRSSIITCEGDPEEQITDFAVSSNAGILLCPASFKSLIKRYRKMVAEQGRAIRETAVCGETERSQATVMEAV